MAIDSTLFAATIPAATYAVGDKVTLKVIRGPAVVRDGYGQAILKRIVCVANTTAANTVWNVEIKNSNWIDAMSKRCSGMKAAQFRAGRIVFLFLILDGK